MTQETVPDEAPPPQAAPQPAPQPQGPPKGLLQQMEELMAALTADLSQLDAELQSSGESPSADAPRSPASPREWHAPADPAGTPAADTIGRPADDHRARHAL
ncbi:hypothetical protein ACH4U6_27605 [Streptomyces netropsis]|uniref:hypothetical protein n=1 Tax=Streptomyces netropsis TaxID=55404 RepID=UPI00378E5BD3